MAELPSRSNDSAIVSAYAPFNVPNFDDERRTHIPDQHFEGLGVTALSAAVEGLGEVVETLENILAMDCLHQ